MSGNGEEESQNRPRVESPAPRPPLRLGVIGCALGRARWHGALAATPGVRVALLADRDETLARVWARELGSRTPVAVRPEDVFARMGELDALLLAAPLSERIALLRQAMQVGLPTLCEMPPGMGLGDFDALASTPLPADFPLVLPALPRRFDPFFAEVGRQIASGALGDIRQIRCDWSLPMNSLDDADEGLRGDWNALLLAIACQTADNCRQWLGAATSVSADVNFAALRGDDTPGGRRVGEGPLANLIVSMENGQATHHFSRTRTLLADEKYVIRGSKQTLELLVSAGAAGGVTTPRLRSQLPGQPARPVTLDVPASRLAPSHQRVANLLQHFADVVQTDTVPLVTLVDARAALETVHAAYLSGAENTKVLLPLRRPPDIESLLYRQKRLT